MSSPETRGSTAAAAAAIRGQNYYSQSSSSYGPMGSRKLSLFPATPSRCSSRASSVRYGFPTRASELRSIHQDDSGSARFSRSRVVRTQSSASTITPQRPTFGVARSASINLKRRGSQSYLRRTQSLYERGEPAYVEQPFRMEEKPGFLPASSRPGRSPALPMPRTLRDPDALGTKKAQGPGRRFPVSLRINLFEKARWLGRRVSQSFRRSMVPIKNVPTQQVHSETKHYGLSSYQQSSGYSDEGSQYADTVIHHRFWENQSYTASIDNQEDYFTRAPPSEVDGVSPSTPVRMTAVVEPILEVEEPEPVREGQRGFTPFTQPADLKGVDSRRVYSALMKSLTQKFSNRAPANETIAEESEPQDEEPRPGQPSNENARPPSSKVSMEKSPENRKPLCEIVPRTNIDVVEEEEDTTAPPTPIINIGVKRIRSDDALFSQIAQQHEVWQEEATGGNNDGAVPVGALRQLSISNVEKEKDDMAGQARYRTASGKLQENILKDEGGSETDEREKVNDDGMEPVFI
ncbi:hypothetical protein TWF506_003401 [Arthrobotrys conoides]|uniref:Uncharacterized protein n=1 Tax=Arthrobotrys conoides TaxID=74498 RepID=A0AAN8N3W7_9PEZI